MLKSARKAGEMSNFACVLSNARSGKRVKDRRPAQGGGFVTEDQKAKKREEKGENKVRGG